MEKPSESKPVHAKYIDGLRAIAVLSVIVYHLNSSWFPGGFAGVDIFFVISGFVVALSVSEIREKNLPSFIAYFYNRRIIRIAPALIFCLLATFLASASFIPEAWLSQSNQKTGLFAFLGLSNFVLRENTGNYFSPISEFNPFTHTWSLAVEEQFYIAFPLLFYFWLSASKKLSTSIFSVLFAASLVLAGYLTAKDQTQAFYMIWTRFWELSIGVVAFQLLHLSGHAFNSRIEKSDWKVYLGDTGLLVMIIGLYLARPQSAPYPASVIPVIGVAVALVFLHGRKGGLLNALLTTRPAVFIGKISYSLYLWHWPVFVVFRWTCGLESPVTRITAVFLTAVLAVLSYYYIEQPPRRLASRVKRSTSLIIGFAAIAAGYGLATTISANSEKISLSTVTRHKELWYPEGGTITGTGTCHLKTSVIQFDGGIAIKYERTGCSEPQMLSGSVFALGDSHAMQYSGMFKKIAVETGATVFAYTVGGCPYMSLRSWVPGRDDVCKSFGDAAIANILPRIKPGDVVFLPSLRLPRMVDQWVAFGVEAARSEIFSDLARKGREQGVQRALPVLKDIAARGAHILLEAPTPMLQSIPFRCADWFNRSNPICSLGTAMPRASLEELRGPIMQAYDTLQKTVPNISIWDTFPVLCTESECSAFKDGKPLLFDGDHLSYYSNQLLAPVFIEKLHSLKR